MLYRGLIVDDLLNEHESYFISDFINGGIYQCSFEVRKAFENNNGRYLNVLFYNYLDELVYTYSLDPQDLNFANGVSLEVKKFNIILPNPIATSFKIRFEIPSSIPDPEQNRQIVIDNFSWNSPSYEETSGNYIDNDLGISFIQNLYEDPSGPTVATLVNSHYVENYYIIDYSGSIEIRLGLTDQIIYKDIGTSPNGRIYTKYGLVLDGESKIKNIEINTGTLKVEGNSSLQISFYATNMTITPVSREII
jgi:hypothetical protein